ncbi:MAG: recombinase family protein [Deltaproteobacteria bacterium]|nr:recombinase family protein [Deltaproteobacteria bacterium]
MSSWLRIGRAAEELGVCPKTLRRWERAGKIRCVRTVGGHRRFSVLEVSRVRAGRKQVQSIRAALYCRVSSHQQKKQGDLDRQVEAVVEHCKKKGYDIVGKHRDVGGGLNAKRRGLRRLCERIEKGEIIKYCKRNLIEIQF